MFLPHKYFHHFLAPCSSSFISLKEPWTPFSCSFPKMKFQSGLGHTGQCCAQHLSETGKYPYIVYYIHVYNYMLTGSLGWIRKLKKDSQGTEKSLWTVCASSGCSSADWPSMQKCSFSDKITLLCFPAYSLFFWRVINLSFTILLKL